MLIALKDSLIGFNSRVFIYKIVLNKGWVKISIDDTDILQYADKCVGAGAVAFIEATRMG